MCMWGMNSQAARWEGALGQDVHLGLTLLVCRALAAIPAQTLPWQGLLPGWALGWIIGGNCTKNLA